jgi:hypothetical protein
MSNALGTWIGLATLVVLLVSSEATARPGKLYAVTWGSSASLYTVDPATAVPTFVARLNVPFEETQPMGLEATPDGRLFAYSSFRFMEINPTTGVHSTIGSSDARPGTLEGGLAYDPTSNLFYAAGASFDAIITIHPTTGVRTEIGEAGEFGRNLSGLAFSPSGVLYGVALRDSLPDLLVTINKSTGVATPVGPTGLNDSQGLAGLAFDPTDGTLYMAVTDPSPSLYRVDTLTGAATFVGVLHQPGTPPNATIGFVSGLAAAVPEPAGSGAIGALSLIVLARRRGRGWGSADIR